MNWEKYFNVLPSAKPVIPEAMQQRIKIMEGIAHGERTVSERRTMTHHQAETRLTRWLHHLSGRSDESVNDTPQNAAGNLSPLPE